MQVSISRLLANFLSFEGLRGRLRVNSVPSEFIVQEAYLKHVYQARVNFMTGTVTALSKFPQRQKKKSFSGWPYFREGSLWKGILFQKRRFISLNKSLSIF